MFSRDKSELAEFNSSGLFLLRSLHFISVDWYFTSFRLLCLLKQWLPQLLPLIRGCSGHSSHLRPFAIYCLEVLLLQMFLEVSGYLNQVSMCLYGSLPDQNSPNYLNPLKKIACLCVTFWDRQVLIAICICPGVFYGWQCIVYGCKWPASANYCWAVLEIYVVSCVRMTALAGHGSSWIWETFCVFFCLDILIW